VHIGDAGHEPNGPVANPGDLSRGDSRQAQCHPATIRVIHPGLTAAPGANIDAALATAAHDLLVALLPSQAALVESAYAEA
jgi:hypothetical protein